MFAPDTDDDDVSSDEETILDEGSMHQLEENTIQPAFVNDQNQIAGTTVFSDNDGEDSAVNTNESFEANPTQQRKNRDDISPPEGGKYGQFQRLIQKGGEGITVPLHLGPTGQGAEIVIQPSASFDDYIAVDLNARQVLTGPFNTPREFNEKNVEKLETALLNSLGPKTEVKDMKGWEILNNGRLEHAPVVSPLAMIDEEEGQMFVLLNLMKPFSDNLKVAVKHMKITGKEGEYLKPRNVLRQFLRYLGWFDGHRGDADLARKYHLPRSNQKQSGTVPLADQKFHILVKGADIPLMEINALYALLHIAQEKDANGKNKIMHDIESGSNNNIEAAINKFKAMFPEAQMVLNHERVEAGVKETHLSSAFRMSAQFIEPVDKDTTQDTPCTYDIEQCKRLLTVAGFEIRNDHSAKSMGINAMKTNVITLKDGRTVQILIYNKDIEGFQAAAGSRERKVDNKFFYTGCASTENLRAKYAHRAYQERGIGRIEACTTGIWSDGEIEGYIFKVRAIIEPAMCVHSIHDKAKLIDRRVASGYVLALLFVDIYRQKIELARKRHQAAGKRSERKRLEGIPHAMVSYYINSATRTTIGRTISSITDGRTYGNGFSELVSALATEAPCGIPIILLVAVGDAMKEFFEGGKNPIVWFRRLDARKVADLPEQMVMHIPRRSLTNPGINVDLESSCGIRIDEMDHMRFAIHNTPQTYHGTGLDLEFGSPFCVQIKTVDRLYRNYNGLPAELTSVLAGVRPRTPDENEGDDPFNAYFDYQGTLFAFPGNRERDIKPKNPNVRPEPSPDSETCLWIRAQGPGPVIMSIRIRYDSLQWTLGLDTNLIETARRLQSKDIPVQSQHMKILKLQRTHYNGRGVSYEAYLQDEGKFSLPLTTTKRLVSYLIEQEIVDKTQWNHSAKGSLSIVLDSDDHRFYLGHTESKFGRVKGGTSDEEFVEYFRKAKHSDEFISIIRPEPARSTKRTRSPHGDCE